MITSRSSLQTQEQTSGWKFFEIVSFKTNISPSDVLETAQIRTTNCTDTEYFEADDNKDLIKMEEEDDAEGNGLGTFNSENSIGKRQEKLKLR